MIVNLTQHDATSEQVAAGVVELSRTDDIHDLLTFVEIPDEANVQYRAKKLAEIARAALLVFEDPYNEPDGFEGYVLRDGAAAMIGGAPYLMAPLEKALLKRGITPMYAFSKRESIEEPQPCGSVKKVMIFRHLGFVEVSL